MVGWVFFRAETLSYAISFIKAMAGLSSYSNWDNRYYFYLNNYSVLIIFIACIGSTPIFKVGFSNILRFKNVMLFKTSEAINVLLYLTLFYLSLASLANHTFNPFIYARF